MAERKAKSPARQRHRSKTFARRGRHDGLRSDSTRRAAATHGSPERLSGTMSKPVRILMYSQDSYGLGHLRRATNLANALVNERSDLSILLVVDSPVAPFFDLQRHIDFVKLPTVVKVGAGVFRPGSLLTSYGLIKAMRSTVNREVLARFHPDLVLVDHMPGGANRDLVPALRLIRSLDYPTRVVLGVRDIIDDPAVTCAVWQREGFYDTLKRYYTSSLIFGSPDVCPTAAKYEIDQAMPGNAR